MPAAASAGVTDFCGWKIEVSVEERLKIQLSRLAAVADALESLVVIRKLQLCLDLLLEEKWKHLLFLDTQSQRRPAAVADICGWESSRFLLLGRKAPAYLQRKRRPVAVQVLVVKRVQVVDGRTIDLQLINRHSNRRETRCADLWSRRAGQGAEDRWNVSGMMALIAVGCWPEKIEAQTSGAVIKYTPPSWLHFPGIPGGRCWETMAGGREANLPLLVHYIRTFWDISSFVAGCRSSGRRRGQWEALGDDTAVKHTLGATTAEIVVMRHSEKILCEEKILPSASH
ncbi:hypothetical protein DL98DRAFT_531931 [Cadophora sp. DSE1049]|nr:hypothetical protein DL98DRAFT_531931 [Cadophora sp. DSE1049]